MSAKKHAAPKPATPPVATIDKNDYKHTLRLLQIELVKLQRHFIRCKDRILVIFEGRDAAGKDGTIKRIVQHLSPRETRVVALGRPSEADLGAWYFQRYVAHLPTAEQFVLFNRSWYNRAGVERVMGFCNDAQYQEFIATVVDFEQMLVRSGIKLLKYYLDISQAEQVKRLDQRRDDPLKQWKISPIDAEAVRRWHDYSAARNEMFARTHAPSSPWTVIRADRKRVARLNLIKDLLLRLDYDGKDESLVLPNPDIVFTYDEASLGNGMIAA